MKKVLAVVLSTLLLVATVPMGALSTITVSAATSGTTGDCTWTLDGTHLTISGNGKMGDYSSTKINGTYRTTAPWGWEITSVTIMRSVTTIGYMAFDGCTFLTSVTIPDSVTTIGDWAFNKCTALTSVTIPDGVTTIGKYAFDDCTSLTSIVLSANLTSIEKHAFSFCPSLTSVTIPNSVTSIGEWAFFDCDSLTSVIIPDSVTIIGKYAFDDCNSLTSVIIPDSVTSIGDSAFQSCESLTAVIIPNSVTTIGMQAFSECTSLASVTIPGSVTTIGKYAFSECTSLTSIALSANVTSIEENAFYGCTSLTAISVSVANSNYSSMDGVLFNKEQSSLIQCPGGKSGEYIIPGMVTTIEKSAFYGCYSLTSVTISNNVTSIGKYAFRNCASLTSITIPDSVTTIGKYAFYYCPSLTDVYYRGFEADRANISIGEENYNLINATWHYNYAPVCDHVYNDDADPDCNACGVLRWAVCPDADVTVRHEDGTTLPAGTSVTVSAVKIDESDVNLDEKTALVQVYDISLLLNGQKIQPDGMVAVTLPAPTDAAHYTDLQVVYIDDTGNVIPCETVVNPDGSITFTTNHFSYYAIVGIPAVVYGDANGDGAVNNRDVALLQQYINKWEVVLDMTAADANGDGAVNNRDMALLQQYINKWDVTLGKY